MTIVESAFIKLIALSKEMMMNSIAISTKKFKKERVKQTSMKYIRTKDCIHNYAKHYGDLYRCKTKQEFNKRQKKGLMSIYYSENYKTLYVFSYGGFYMLNILKQADTIEELCDEFRGIWTNYFEDGKDAHEEYHYDKEKNVFYDDFEELTHKAAIEKFDIFYGAIWTDKGLIYVAKMNDKGELELL